MQRLKFYCEKDDYVTKAQHSAICPMCGNAMKNMGKNWRPGRRGSRIRMWDSRKSISHYERHPSYYGRIAYGRRGLRNEQQSSVPQYSPYRRQPTIWDAIFGRPVDDSEAIEMILGHGSDSSTES